jgi:putative transposase
MTRLARVVVPGLPHHVTQRGNRREPIFFEDGDQEVYLDLLAEQARKAKVEVWAYCLMPNHVHLILTPDDEVGLARALGETHRRYTNFINARGRWTGHLFQKRFGSVVMDETHLCAAFLYVALNPVRARLVARAADWPWASTAAHLAGRDDGLATARPLIERMPDFPERLAEAETGASGEVAGFQVLRRAETTGRPAGNAEFVGGLERLLGRPLARRAPGRKPAEPVAAQELLL